MSLPLAITVVGLLIFFAHLFEKIFAETKIPDVLLLMILGLFVGPVFELVSVDDFGVVGPIFVTLALIVILFQSGTKMRYSIVKENFGGAIMITILSFLVTSIFVSVPTYFLTDLGIANSALVGVILGGTSSAIVIPILSRLKISIATKTMLELESAFSDVFVIIISFALINALGNEGSVTLGILEQIGASFLVAILFGVVFGFVWSILLEKVRHLQGSTFSTGAFVFILYGFTELLGYSGAIAVLALGIFLGNVDYFKLPLLSQYLPIKPVSLSKREKSFFSEIAFLVKTFFFVFIGISISLDSYTVALLGIALTIIIAIARYVTIRLFAGSYQEYERYLMMSLFPKGLAAAVVASYPLRLGLDGGDLIQDVTYAAILFSIVLTSFFVFLAEKTKLQVAIPESTRTEVRQSDPNETP